MPKRFKPEAKREYDIFDDHTSYEGVMTPDNNGDWIHIESHNQTVRDYNKLKKKFERYERRLKELEGTK